MYNDYELLYLAKENNEEAIDILYSKYQKLLYMKAFKYSSSDLTLEDYLNEAKLSLYEAIQNYKDSTSFSTYLNKCLDNALLNYRKSLSRNKNKLLNEAISINDEKNDMTVVFKDKKYNPEELLFMDYDYHTLRKKIIDKLTWKEELVFTLKEQNYTSREISEITDNNLKTVYNIIKRIQNKVSNIMSN
ncbi:MAG: sigma-70 family RNA polymerase sigma factor [Bacilli bacterium]